MNYVIKEKMKSTKHNLALVLSGGGARGMAHIGVLRILEQNNIVPDIILGTSSGALIGGMYAAGNLNQFEKELIAKPSEIKNLLHIWPSRDGLIRTSKLEEEFRRIIGNRKIEELDKKFVSLSIDLLTGKKVLIDKGDLVEAILASISIPLVFPPVYKEKMLLVDGGLEDPLPIDEGFKIAKKVVVVNIFRSLENIPKKEKYSFIDILERALIIVENEISENAIRKYKRNLVLLKIDVNMDTLDFSRAKEAITAGEEETKKRIDDIKNLLNRI